jgi:hypothetical protein
MLMAALVAVVVAALALPAMAHNKRFNDNNQRDNKPWNNNWWGFNDWWWQHHNNDDNVPTVTQANEQEVQSGDSTQTFNVKGGGDNSNSCQGIQDISNTGNSVTNTGVIQSGSNGSFVGVSDSGNFTISPSQSTVCKQSVNQAASATSSGR